MDFSKRLFLEYPVPQTISIWGGDGLERVPLEDIGTLIECCVDELASDLLITGHIEATGMSTYMPKGTVSCSSAMLSGAYPFQGNRNLKVTYDKANNIAYLRYYPAIITYRRKLLVDDLAELDGDRLIYIKSYVLWKMAEKELQYLKNPTMNVDNGQLDYSVLEKFRDTMHDDYVRKKDDIMLYACHN